MLLSWWEGDAARCMQAAAWFAGDDGDPEIDLAIAALAWAELER